MDLSLEQRLLRFLRREEEGEQQSHRDLRAMSIDERVIEGECIAQARFRERRGDAFHFSVADNSSKFRRDDSVLVSDGVAIDEGLPMTYAGFRAGDELLVLVRDPFRSGDGDPEFVKDQHYCIDRRPLSVRGRLAEVVLAGFRDPVIREVLEGKHQPLFDADRLQRAQLALAERKLNEAQLAAACAAIANERLALIQGPPGTGKTRVVAEIVRALCAKGCRIALTAFTHRAVDNVLLTLRRLDPSVPVVKLGARPSEDLQRAGIRVFKPHARLPGRGVVIGGTSFALAKLRDREEFHFTVVDEAGQMPIPHAMAGMLLSKRWIFVGDHMQLAPVITSHHADRQATASVFEHLHRHYGSQMLDVSYRLNGPLCEVVGETFYAGRLRSAQPDRRMPFVAGGRHDDILDPESPVVLARVDHLQPGMRSVQEARLVADLVDDLLNQHRIPGAEIAIVTPFRAQVRAIRSALQKKEMAGTDDIVIDTVERMQGQEREVVLVSLAVGDPDTLKDRGSFFFSTNRINVAISRARTKAVIVASAGVFRALPMEPEILRTACLFKRLMQRLPSVDVTRVYA